MLDAIQFGNASKGLPGNAQTENISASGKNSETFCIKDMSLETTSG